MYEIKTEKSGDRIFIKSEIELSNTEVLCLITKKMMIGQIHTYCHTASKDGYFLVQDIFNDFSLHYMHTVKRATQKYLKECHQYFIDNALEDTCAQALNFKKR